MWIHKCEYVPKKGCETELPSSSHKTHIEKIRNLLIAFLQAGGKASR